MQVAELRDEGCLGLVASTKGLGLRFREDMVARAYERLHGRPPGPTLRFFEVQLPHRFADPAEVQKLVSAMSWEAHVVRSYQGWGDRGSYRGWVLAAASEPPQSILQLAGDPTKAPVLVAILPARPPRRREGIPFSTRPPKPKPSHSDDALRISDPTTFPPLPTSAAAHRAPPFHFTFRIVGASSPYLTPCAGSNRFKPSALHP